MTKTKEEFLKAFKPKLLPYVKNWKGVYGSPGQIGYRRIDVWEEDFVVGLIYAPSDDALAFFAGRQLVTKIEDDYIYCDIYGSGEKSQISGKDKIGRLTSRLVVLEEQSDDVLYELYLKGVFKKDYGKEKWEECKRIREDYEREEFLKYQPIVDRAIKAGTLEFKIETEEKPHGTFHTYVPYLNNKRMMGFGYGKEENPPLDIVEHAYRYIGYWIEKEEKDKETLAKENI